MSTSPPASSVKPIELYTSQDNGKTLALVPPPSDIPTDLFGAPVPPQNNKGKRKSPVPKGYVFMPGTGPAGETCGSCKHLARIQYAKVYLKCGLNKGKWTSGDGSDVRARSPACKKWEKPE